MWYFRHFVLDWFTCYVRIRLQNIVENVRNTALQVSCFWKNGAIFLISTYLCVEFSNLLKLRKFHHFSRKSTLPLLLQWYDFIHLARTFFLFHTTLISQTFYAFFPNRERHFPNLYMPLSIGSFHGQANSATNSHKQPQTIILTIYIYIRGTWYLE